MCNTSLYYIYIYFFRTYLYRINFNNYNIYTKIHSLYIYIYIIKSFDMEKMRKQNKENQ